MRIRSVKPEFWTDDVTGLMVAEVALFFVGLWNVADDDGRFRWDAMLIRAALDPYDAKWGGAEGIERQLANLERLGRIVRYRADDGRTYGFIPSFSDHQKPNRKAQSKIPSPPPGAAPRRLATAEALPTQCARSEEAVRVQGGLTPGEERRGEESSGAALAGFASQAKGESAPAKYPHARPAVLAYRARLRDLRGRDFAEPRTPGGEKLARFDAACASLTPEAAGSILAEEVHDRLERGALQEPPVSLAYLLDWLEEQAQAATRGGNLPPLAEGECPKYGDPRFDDDRYWPTYQQFLDRSVPRAKKPEAA